MVDRRSPNEAELQDSGYWRSIAEQTREWANGMDSPDHKERMLEIAAEYDKLAVQLERTRQDGSDSL
jgi:hypothetical protein